MPDLPTENSAVSAMLRSCACMLGTGPCADRAAGKYQVKNLKCEWNREQRNNVQCSITERFVATRLQDRKSTRLNSSHKCASRMTTPARKNKQTSNETNEP